MTGHPTPDIRFIEDVASTDNRLFTLLLFLALFAVGQRVGLSMDRLKVRGYKADGSYDIIPTRKNGCKLAYRADMNSASQRQLQSIWTRSQPGHA